jgi:outer membrane protein assembly factor BamB
MYCLNRNSGEIEWQKDIRPDSLEKVHRVSSPATATPATDGERVLFYFGSYGLICYDTEGNLQWEYPIEMPVSRYNMGTSPVIHSDLVILNCFGYEQDPSLLALNKKKGELIWKYNAPHEEGDWNDSYSTPIIYKDEVIIYRDDDVSGYNIQSGEQVWRFKTGMADAVCTPVIGNNILYIPIFSTYGNKAMLAQIPLYMELYERYDQDNDRKISKQEIEGYGFKNYPEKGEVSDIIYVKEYFFIWDKNRDDFIDSLEWDGMREYCESLFDVQGLKAIRLGSKGDISLENFLWGYNEDVSHVASPLFYKDHVYMIKSGGILSCLNAQNGELIYSERIGATGAYFSSPVAVNDRIYFISRNGIVTVIDAGDELKILAQNDLDDIIATTPAILDDKIYIRTEQTLFAFGK